MGRVYGIDLGTTYSCIAVIDEGRPRVLSNSEGKPTTPSVVFFETPDNIVVGENAKDVAKIYPDRVVSTVKRAMGDKDWSVEIHGQTYTAQEISAHILRKLVHDAQLVTNEEIKDVVITVPAYFGVNERAATEQAGQIAGLNVLRVVPEPTAAAIAYGMDQDEQTLMVYDLGGGTFDITVIDVKEGENGKEVNVICTGGDHQLGGKNWDETVANYFASAFEDKTGIEADRLLEDPETYQELLDAGESNKEKLSSLQNVDHRVMFEADRSVCNLTREKLHELTGALLERTIELTDELYETAKEKGYGKIDKILLVGGSTHMPQVQTRLEAWCEQRQLTETEICKENPNEIVACGAAWVGLKADDKKQEDGGYGLPPSDLEEIDDTRIRDATAHSFGIVVVTETGDYKLCNLITMNDALPKSNTHDFGTATDAQPGATIRCMENRSPTGPDDLIDFEPDWEIGRAELMFERPLPKNSPIEITFSLAEDGQLTVDARDLTTDSELQAVFQTESVLSDAEVEEARERAMAVRLGQ